MDFYELEILLVFDLPGLLGSEVAESGVRKVQVSFSLFVRSSWR